MENVKEMDVLGLLIRILEYESVEVFPNLSCLVSIFLTIALSVASYERDFSKSKLIMNCLRSAIPQLRLNGLAIL